MASVTTHYFTGDELAKYPSIRDMSDQEKVKIIVKDLLIPGREKFFEEHRELIEKNAEYEKTIKENRSIIAQNRETIALNRETIALNRETIALNRETIAQNRETVAKLDLEINEREARIAERTKKINAYLVKVFYSIFHGSKPVPENEIDIIFQKYIPENSITVEKEDTQDEEILKACHKLKSFEGIKKYLKDNPTINKLDLRSFTSHVYDVARFVSFIQEDTSRKAVGIALKNFVSNEVKAELAKSSKIKVQYFA